jgi:C-terminal processing protease CtpA/Prc
MSASEWFVMALRTQDHVTHVGTRTSGAFSARVIRPLINGWEYSVSIQKVTDMDGKCYEGTGISPNKEHIVENIWEEIYHGRDAQLDYALSVF